MLLPSPLLEDGRRLDRLDINYGVCTDSKLNPLRKEPLVVEANHRWEVWSTLKLFLIQKLLFARFPHARSAVTI